MDLGIIIAVGCLAFGFGIWFYRITSKLARLDDKLTPLVILHKEELIKYYLEKGIIPNPSLAPRKQYLINKLEVGTISYDESQELAKQLREEEKEARKAGNTDAVVAILGLIALVVILASLLKK